MAASVDKLRKDVQKAEELEDVKKKADEAFKEIERLKAELETVKTDKNKQREYANAADTLSSADWYNKGHNYAENKEYDKAIEAYTSAIALDPNFVQAYNNRGVAYAYKGQYDRAIEDFNKAIALDPNNALTYRNRGHAYHLQGQYDKAIDDFNKAIQLDPNYADAYYNISCYYSIQKNADNACAYLEKSIEKGYKNWDWIKKDKDFDNIRNESCYKQIMKGK